VNPQSYIDALCSVVINDVFNPYAHRCPVHDLEDAPARRRDALLNVVEAATKREIDAIWIGRDLGYRGGRRTGLALTDDVHFSDHIMRWGLSAERPTAGAVVAERTAAVIWSVLANISAPVFLWNVFPYHPHESSKPFSNRSHNARERRIGEELLFELIDLLRPRRIIAIGNDAASSAHRIMGTSTTVAVRHPSYGGIRTYLGQMRGLYNLAHAQR
jgi:hypothetical protein